MSKVLRGVAVVAGVVATAASFGLGGAAAASIMKITAAVSTAASVGAQLTAKPPRAKGQVTSITIGANQPIPYMIGRSYSGGAMIHDVGWGGIVDKVENPYRAMTMVYSGAGPIHALVATQADFTDVSFSGTAATGYYAGFLWRDWLDGSGPAPRALAAQWAGEPSWTSTHRLSGFFAAKYSLRFDKKGQAWQAGVPQFGIIADGVRVYDPRFDSTYPGGTGAQRIGNEGTYAFSKNPAAHALTYAYGRYQNGKKIFGLGSSVQAIDLANIVAWANLCDANGWEVNGTIYEPGDRWNNLKLIAAAGGAVPVVTAGVLRFDYAAPVVSLDTLTVDDLGEGEISVPATQAFADKLNTVTGSYTSPAHRWEEVPTDRISDAGYLTADGEEKAEAFAFPLVTNKDQAARLAAYKLVESREIGPIQLPAKARFMRYPVGSAFTLNLPPLGLVGQVVKVKGRSVNPLDGTIELTLMTETAGKHAFALGRTTTAPPAPVLVPPQELDRLSLSSFELTQDPDTLTIGEKIQTVIPKENARSGTNGRYPTVRARMVALGLSVTALDTASANWLAHRNGIANWNTITVHSTIVRTTWDSFDKAFDDALNLGDVAISEEDARRARVDGSGNLVGDGTTVANNQITVNGTGQLNGIGSGAGTTVANNQITISGGNIGGIGTGAGTEVENSRMDIAFDTGGTDGRGRAQLRRSNGTVVNATVQLPSTLQNIDQLWSQVQSKDVWLTDSRIPNGLDAAGRGQVGIVAGTGAVLTNTDIMGTVNGTNIARNPEFLDGTTFGWNVYNNAGGTRVTMAIVADAAAPNASGSILRVSYDGTGTPDSNPTPGFGGVVQTLNDALVASGDARSRPGQYSRGTTIIYVLIVRIPVGRTLNFHTNSYGTDGTFEWLTPTTGTGNWQRLVARQRIGTTGTFAETGYFAVSGGANVAFTWDIAKCDHIDITSANRVLLGRGGLSRENGLPLFDADVRNQLQQWGDVNSRPANLSALGGSETIRNDLITIASGALNGIGTGAGTVVANNQITIASGALNGIGTGNGTAVANSLVQIDSNGNFVNAAAAAGNGTNVANNINRGSLSTIAYPDDGTYALENTITGAIRIRLPGTIATGLYTMVKFQVDIYDYNDGRTVTYDVGGYVYSLPAGPSWINCSAKAVGGGAGSVKPVRFARTGSAGTDRFCLVIGDVSTVWSYPKVQIRNLIAGYTTFDVANWRAGWNIDVVTTLPAATDIAVLNPTAGDAVFGVNALEAWNGAVATLANFKTIQGTAAAIVGQGSGATANTLAQLDATAAAQLSSAVNGAAQSVARSATIEKVLNNNASVSIDAASAIFSSGGGATYTLQLKIREVGGTDVNVGSAASVAIAASESDYLQVSGSFTNTSGGTRRYQITCALTKVGAGTAVETQSQSYLRA